MDKRTFNAAIEAARKMTFNGQNLSQVGEADDVSLGISNPGTYCVTVLWYGPTSGPSNAKTPWAPNTPTLVIGLSTVINGEVGTPIPVMMKQINVARLIPQLQSAAVVKKAHAENTIYKIEVEKSRDGIPTANGREFYPMVLRPGTEPREVELSN